MEPMIEKFLGQMEIGQIEQWANMAVAPLFSNADAGPEYITLPEALNAGLVTVTEVTENGRAPELKVINNAEKGVLFLDGEELAGAKQNRVLNTTVLAPAGHTIIIPVSCTEAGRWSYRSPHFADSGVVMAPRQRMRKSRSVHESLRSSGGFRSDQQEVWNDVQEMAERVNAHSPTSAMSDVYRARAGELSDYLEAFAPKENQKGLLAIVNGKVIGFDVLSREAAYGWLHPRLIESYAMGALLEREQAKAADAESQSADAFLREAIADCKQQDYDSPGWGRDYRFRGPGIVGSVLAGGDVVIHAAFFRTEDGDDGQRTGGRIAGYRRRRNFRE